MSSVLVFDGDSISLGVGAGLGFTLADQILPLLPAVIDWHGLRPRLPLASHGHRCREDAGRPRQPADPDDRQQDHAAGRSLRRLRDRQADEPADLAHRRGWHIIVSTKLQRYDWPETARSIVTELNGLIIENKAKADGVADFQSNPTMNGDLVRLDRTYYTADQVHPADAGYTILAGIAAAALLPYLTPYR